MEVLVAVAFGGIVFSETAAAQGQVAAVVIAELGQTMATVAVLLLRYHYLDPLLVLVLLLVPRYKIQPL